MACDAAEALDALRSAAADTRDARQLGEHVVRAVKRAVPHAGWVGIYWVRGSVLELGPYVGQPTEHVRIPRGRGVCGTAWAEDLDQRVPDVRAVSNYLSCSASVRSELVVLIRSQDQVVGQIDLDADAVAAFDEGDHCVVRAVADCFGALIDPVTDEAPAPADEAQDDRPRR